MVKDKPEGWVDKEELADVTVKWGFSYFDGAGRGLNTEGDHNFTIILDEATARDLKAKGWNVKEYNGSEDNPLDEPEFTLKIKISAKFGMPMVYFIKGEGDDKRKIRINDTMDLREITRDSCERLDIVMKPSPWGPNARGESGYTAYIEEMYAVIRESRFGAMYADYDEA